MPSWSDFADAAPELAATVRARLDAHPYKLLATLRKDGSPRVSGIEVEFLDDGELRTGSMPESVKVYDLDRDNRFCLHNTPAPQAEWVGDAKLTGFAHPTTGPRDGARYYRLDLHEVATVSVESGGLVISVWTPERGVRSWTR
jgi:hypothetical protein